MIRSSTCMAVTYRGAPPQANTLETMIMDLSVTTIPSGHRLVAIRDSLFHPSPLSAPEAT